MQQQRQQEWGQWQQPQQVATLSTAFLELQRSFLLHQQQQQLSICSCLPSSLSFSQVLAPFCSCHASLVMPQRANMKCNCVNRLALHKITKHVYYIYTQIFLNIAGHLSVRTPPPCPCHSFVAPALPVDISINMFTAHAAVGRTLISMLENLHMRAKHFQLTFAIRPRNVFSVCVCVCLCVCLCLCGCVGGRGGMSTKVVGCVWSTSSHRQPRAAYFPLSFLFLRTISLTHWQSP